MSEQRPEQGSEHAKKQLHGILSNITQRAKTLTEQLFGRLDETNIPPEEIEKLKETTKDMTPQERAKACYKLNNRYRNDASLPEPFEKWLNKQKGKS